MALVFKVKLQETIRRWVATEAFNTNPFPITFGQLEAKIKELFNLSPSVSLAITYVDGDNDVVTLADDLDLIDACVVQLLNPLRLDVHVLGDNFNSLKGAQGLPCSPNHPESAGNYNFGSPQNVEAIRGFLRTHAPLIDPTMPAMACLSRLEMFLNDFTAHHPKNTQKSASSHPIKRSSHAVSSPHPRDASLHWGIECDGCGISPIQGVRYKSTKQFNYDLCGDCFKKIGDDNGYEKLERPVFRPPHHGHFRPPGFRRGPRPCPAPPGCRAWFARGPYGWKPNHASAGNHASGSFASEEHKKLDARFVKDVTIFDGTELFPGSKFTKIWRMSNIGALPWPQNTQLVHIGGDMLSPEETVALQLPEGGLPCGEEVEVSVDLTAPERAGRYDSHWRLTAPSGQKFGHRVWVVIHVVPEGEHSPQVQASLENSKIYFEENQRAIEADHDGSNTVVMDVDLNGANKVVLDVVVEAGTVVIEQLALEKSGHDDTENVHPSIVYSDPFPRGLNDVVMSSEKGKNNLFVYPDPTSYDVQDVGTSTEKMSDVYPDPTSYDVQDVGTSTEKMSEGVGSRKHEVDGFSLVEKPTETTDWIEVTENESFHTPEGPAEGEEGAQEQLLQSMEAMGFADRSVIMSALQKHNFVLQDAVDDLVAVAGYNGALKDLEEMGFIERATNIQLLVKNNGSLKQTVRDLVKLEKVAADGRRN